MLLCRLYALVICNHAPKPPGGGPGIAGEMCQVFLFAMSRQWWVNAVVLFSPKNSADYSLGLELQLAYSQNAS